MVSYCDQLVICLLNSSQRTDNIKKARCHEKSIDGAGQTGLFSVRFTH